MFSDHFGRKKILILISAEVINLLFTLIAIGPIDRAGRKPLLLSGLEGTFLSMPPRASSFNPRPSRTR